ncbi:hypothetical protein HMPREF1870_01738 [Bacteroidales bacterium KA00344]|nr:hypothetical protein HMPREF1870_01738 [Bacteroidales bacterium KA00344]
MFSQLSTPFSGRPFIVSIIACYYANCHCWKQRSIMSDGG